MGKKETCKVGPENRILILLYLMFKKDGPLAVLLDKGDFLVKRLILLIFLFFISSYSFADEKRYVIPLEDSPVYGPQNAPVTIFEFLDYQ